MSSGTIPPDSQLRTSSPSGKIGITGAPFLSLNGLLGKFSILNLRKAEAQQKYSEISQSQSKDYVSQLQAHFGDSPSRSLAGLSEYLGGFTSVIQIGDVENTNLTHLSGSVSASPKATIAGKGTNAVNGHIRYKSHEHGCLMCIYHCQPMPEYDSLGVDKFNTKVSFGDFAIPEFDSIGMQTVNHGELFTPTVDGVPNFSDSLFTSPIGYAPRYAEYKTAVDKNYGSFITSLKDWVTPLKPDYYNSHLDYSRFIKVHPDCLDSIFGVAVDNTIDTDQFLINSYFDVKAVLPLDRNGLPY